MIRQSTLAVTALLFSSVLLAQCPPSATAGVHVVQKGETFFRIAKNYGVTTAQLAIWNNTTQDAKVIECQELVVSASLTNPAPASPATYSGSYPTTPEKQSGNWHTVRRGETAAQLAQLYGYTEERFREFNNIPAWKVLNPGAVVRSSECNCNAAATAVPSPTMASRGVATPVAAPRATTNRSYMTLAESAMIDEINLLRANPAAYVPYVRDFVETQKMRAGKTFASRYVNSLINTLQKTSPMGPVQAHPCLYQVAQKQGDYLRRTKSFSHNDALGVGPWSRTKNACPQVDLGTSKLQNGMTVGNENLVAGMSTAREAVIYLLIDEYEPTVGHRATLLAPEWRYVAAYNFGTINNMPNHYVQMFGR